MNLGTLAQAGWLDDITNWLGQQLTKLWDALLQLVGDAFLWVLDQVLNAFSLIIEAIPVPEFLQHGLGGLFSGLPPDLLYFVGLFRIPEGLLILAAGVAFNLTRKLLTLGQW